MRESVSREEVAQICSEHVCYQLWQPLCKTLGIPFFSFLAFSTVYLTAGHKMQWILPCSPRWPRYLQATIQQKCDQSWPHVGHHHQHCGINNNNHQGMYAITMIIITIYLFITYLNIISLLLFATASSRTNAQFAPCHVVYILQRKNRISFFCVIIYTYSTSTDWRCSFLYTRQESIMA